MKENEVVMVSQTDQDNTLDDDFFSKKLESKTLVSSKKGIDQSDLLMAYPFFILLMIKVRYEYKKTHNYDFCDFNCMWSQLLSYCESISCY